MFFRRGPNFDYVFLVDLERESPNPIISGPSSGHLNGVLLAGRWWSNIECWLGSFVMRSGPVLLRNPIFLRSCQGGGGEVPPLDPRMRLPKRTKLVSS